MAHYAYNSEAKFGEPHHKTTPRELMAFLSALKSDDPAWDEPIDIMLSGGSLSAYNFTVEDVTGDCDGSCQHPQCVATLPDDDPRVYDVESLGAEAANGYTDEGLHFRPTLWANNDRGQY